MSNQDTTRHDQVLLGLVFSLQAGAMQQLGKIQNPMTGEIQKDLEQARATIDVLEMLKVKCRTETPEDVLRLLDGAVMDLQLNYMDEVKKAAAGPDESANGETPEAPAEQTENSEETGGAEADG
jgi:uncharacterized protein DUF1844